MAYARVWTKNAPLGSVDAKDIDQEIRNLREDVEQRVAAVVTGWSTGAPTDPVVPVVTLPITTAEIADGAVTSAKLAAGVIPDPELPKHVAQAFYNGSSGADQNILNVLVNVGLIEIS